MEKITEFNRKNLKELRPEIQAVLDMIHHEYGVKIELGSMSFSADKFTARITGYAGEEADKGRSERRENEFEQCFRLQSFLLGLKETDLGKKFGMGGKDYILIGMKPKAQKYPLLGKDVETGKTFKFSVDSVKAGLGYIRGERNLRGGFYWAHPDDPKAFR